ncbi:MAG TPA: hypothetical protein VLA96_12320 [Terriglobales bacterium]|nr:hypothetical protein [Terriglobales bacterium]
MRRLLWVCMLLLVAVPAVAHPGWGIVRDARGNVFFTDLKQVWMLSAAGALSVAVPRVHTHELVLDKDGNLYGENLTYDGARNQWHNYFWKRTPSGELATTVPDGEVLRGFSLLKDAAGNMYSIEQNNHARTRTLLLKRAPRGEAQEFAGGAFGIKDGTGKDAQLSSVGGVDVLPDGTIYLVDGATLRKVTPDGQVTTLARGLDRPRKLIQGTAGLANAFFGVRHDGEGSVYVADYDNRRVLKLSADGKQRVTAYESSLGWAPTGVWVAGDTLYVLEGRHPFGDSVRVVEARNGRGSVRAKVP